MQQSTGQLSAGAGPRAGCAHPQQRVQRRQTRGEGSCQRSGIGAAVPGCSEGLCAIAESYRTVGSYPGATHGSSPIKGRGADAVAGGGGQRKQSGGGSAASLSREQMKLSSTKSASRRKLSTLRQVSAIPQTKPHGRL